jgi:hypothetical protein
MSQLGVNKQEAIKAMAMSYKLNPNKFNAYVLEKIKNNRPLLDSSSTVMK